MFVEFCIRGQLVQRKILRRHILNCFLTSTPMQRKVHLSMQRIFLRQHLKERALAIICRIRSNVVRDDTDSTTSHTQSLGSHPIDGAVASSLRNEQRDHRGHVEHPAGHVEHVAEDAYTSQHFPLMIEELAHFFGPHGDLLAACHPLDQEVPGVIRRKPANVGDHESRRSLCRRDQLANFRHGPRPETGRSRDCVGVHRSLLFVDRCELFPVPSLDVIQGLRQRGDFLLVVSALAIHFEDIENLLQHFVGHFIEIVQQVLRERRPRSHWICLLHQLHAERDRP
mmetsp:Transcript_17357/g.47112  ORF Transcript_17357/g.47112 Transcript_17357/m.47112 type:complete len:283 (-) Transcript_17357:447-1295(-)